MYGCRDSGAIWEATYSQALIGMGFKQWIASHCCFYHPIWEISCVVHEDDFTAIGTAANLDLYEAAMCQAFECKINGWLGREPGDLDEMRVLNHMFRVVPSGLCSEPDPRHVELLIRALNLENGASKATPGIKIPFDEIDHAPSDLQDFEDLVAAVRLHERAVSKVTFSEDVTEISSITPWYHPFPSSLCFSLALLVHRMPCTLTRWSLT